MKRSSTRRFMMSLLWVLCSITSVRAAEPDKTLRWTAPSDGGLFRVTIRPEAGTMPIGKFHSWVIGVVDGEGKPVDGAQITIGGGMEAHGHGLPTAPKVTHARGKGEYLVEGMKFTMSGEWTLAFVIRSGGRQDTARFRLTVDY
jgi:hypothetical protein